MSRLFTFLADGKYYTGFLVAAAAIFVWRSFSVGGYFVDDTYITFRYAKHLAEGLGLVWNIGEAPSEGFTSLLHILLLAIGKQLGMPLDIGTLLFSFVSIACLVICFLWLHKRLVGDIRIPAILLLACYLADSHIAILATAGMETPLFLLLVFLTQVATVLLLTRPSARTALFWFATGLLALWGRPDAFFFLLAEALLLLVFAAGRWKSGSTILARHILFAFSVLTVVGTAYLAWKYYYYGYLLPNTFYVKSGGIDLSGLHHVTAFIERWAKVLFFPVLILLLATDFRKLGQWLVKRENLELLAIALLPPLLFLGYFSTTTHIVCFAFRFESPAILSLILAISLVLNAGYSSEVWRRRTSFLAPNISISIYAIAVVLSFTLSARLSHDQFPWSKIMLKQHYLPIGNALYETGLKDKATLIFDSAGAISYVSEFRHVDPIGLTDNYLSGRTTTDAMQTEEYLWSRSADVYIGTEPPATDGVQRHGDDPRLSGEYAIKHILGRLTKREYARKYGSLTEEERREVMHFRMRELRDNWDLVREAPYPVGDGLYTHFVYVRKASPYYETIAEKVRSIEYSREPVIPEPSN